MIQHQFPRIFAIFFIIFGLSACEPLAIKQGASETQAATLYRNGSLLTDMRVHFASFSSEGEANDFNINNCQMTVRLLNQNVRAQAQPSVEQKVGFWCEPGPYREDGLVPVEFDAAFPTEVTGNPAP